MERQAQPALIRGNRHPWRLSGLAAFAAADLTVHLARDFVAVLHQRVDFDIRKTVQIRANRLHLGLHHRMHGRGVIGQVNRFGDRQKDKTRLLAKIFALHLPDPIPQDIGRCARIDLRRPAQHR